MTQDQGNLSMNYVVVKRFVNPFSTKSILHINMMEYDSEFTELLIRKFVIEEWLAVSSSWLTSHALYYKIP